MAVVSALGYVGLGVADLPAWKAFATDGLLGLRAEESEDGRALFLRMDQQLYRYALHQDPREDVAYIGWEVPSAEALKEVKQRLRENNIEFTSATEELKRQRGVLDLIQFQDPFGLANEVFYGQVVVSEMPFVPSRPIKGFKTGRLGVGHVVLATQSMAQSVKFYEDALGLAVTDYVTFKGLGTVTFLRCNARHHSLAFAEAPIPRKLLHILVETAALDDVGAAYYEAIRQGLGMDHDLGRHTNDGMVSFYVDSPSGFAVEYGYDGIEIDEATWKIQHHLVGSSWGHRWLRGMPGKPPEAAQ